MGKIKLKLKIRFNFKKGNKNNQVKKDWVKAETRGKVS